MNELEIEKERSALLIVLLKFWFDEWRSGRLAVLDGTPDEERKVIWELAKDTRALVKKN